MSGSTTAVIISTYAATQAAAARDTACKSLMNSYEAKTATIAQAREYASCVDHLYPHDMTGAEVIFYKVAIVSIILGVLVGAWMNRNDDTFGRIWGPVAGAFMGGAAVFGLFCTVALLKSGVQFLFR